MMEIPIKILFIGAFSCVLLSLAIEDHRHNRLPNRLTIPLTISGLLLNSTNTLNQLGFQFISFQDSVLGAAIGYAGVRVLQEIQLYRSGHTGIGLGDAKFLAALGAWFGWQSLPVLLVGSSLVMLTVYYRRRDKPFGVGLSITASRYSGHNLLVQFVCMKGNSPNINHIVLADLTDNDRLVELYRQAVQRRIWRDNSERDFIEFANRAMKALHANSEEHPALLFHWLINHPSHGNIPQMCEKITFARFNTQTRQNALALARRSSVARADAQLRDKPEAAGTQIAYLPELYAQHCPFPQNRLTYGQRSWTVRTPAKRIVIMSGSHLLQDQASTGIRSSVWQHTATDSTLHGHPGCSGQTESDDGSEVTEFPQATWDVSRSEKLSQSTASVRQLVELPDSS